MTRSQKVQKLGRAVRSYRGTTDAHTGKWKRRPDLSAKARIERLLGSLGLHLETHLPLIEGFKTMPEFNRWIVSL